MTAPTPVPNPHVKDGISYGHLFASYTEGTADTSLDLDPYPDERFLTGTVLLRPRFSGQQATAVLRVPGTPRSRGLVITEQEYKVVQSRLVDRQDREGVWLMIAVGDIPIHWQATVVLRDVNNRVVLQTAYALSDDSWLSELDGTRYTNLPDLIPNPALITPSELAAINSAHTAMERSLRVAAELEEVRPDIVAAGGRAAEAIEAAEAAEREANRAAGLAAAQDEVVAEHVVTDGRQTRSAVDERILAVGNATYGRKTEFFPEDFGASHEATWQVNKAAFQAAMDAAEAAGGGTVVCTPGTYMVKDLYQGHRVTIDGRGATLKHPSAGDSAIIYSKTRQTNCVSADGTTLVVSDATGIEPGGLIAVRYAGQVNATQWTRLAASISASDTTIPVLTTAAYPTGARYCVRVGHELIEILGKSGNNFTNVRRGAFGTTASAHDSGRMIGLALYAIRVVKATVGTTVILDAPVVQPTSGGFVQVGAIAPQLENLVLDGDRPVETADFRENTVVWELVRWGRTRGVIRSINGAMGGFRIGNGARNCQLDGISIQDSPGGAGFWLFRGANNNTITGLSVTGKNAYHGVYLDDRTVTASEWDMSCEDNLFLNADFDLPDAETNAAIHIVGCRRNRFIGGSTKGARHALIIDSNQQYRADGGATPCDGNEIAYMTWRDHRIGASTRVSGNRIHSIVTSNVITPHWNPHGSTNIVQVDDLPDGAPWPDPNDYWDDEEEVPPTTGTLWLPGIQHGTPVAYDTEDLHPGKLDVRAFITPDNWGSDEQVIAAKWGLNTETEGRSWYLSVGNGRLLGRVAYVNAGSPADTQAFGNLPSIPEGASRWVRLVIDATVSPIEASVHLAEGDASAPGEWTQISSVTLPAGATLRTSVNPWTVGGAFSGSPYWYAGEVERLVAYADGGASPTMDVEFVGPLSSSGANNYVVPAQAGPDWTLRGVSWQFRA